MKRIIPLSVLIIFMHSNIPKAQLPVWHNLPNSPTSSSRFEDIYFCNNDTGYIIHIQGRVIKTTDGGSSWDTTAFVSSGLFRSVGFFTPETGIIGTLRSDTNRILLRTTDGGTNWTYITSFSGGARPKGICGISIVTENIAYACGKYDTPATIVKTTDQGLNWNVVFNDTSLARSLIDCYFWSPDSGIAVGGYGAIWQNGNSVILHTTNGGTNWTRVYRSTRPSEWCWKISFISKSTGFVSIERTSGMTFILKTTNSGLSWTDIPFLNNYDQEGIGFINENTGWVGGWSGATYETTDGGNSWHLAGWGQLVNRIRFLNDTLGYAVGERVYKYSRDVTGINQISQSVPSLFRLYQNFPNPFNPETEIRFDIRTAGMAKLRLYNAAGIQVAELLNTDLRPGTYSVKFNGNDLSSGIYYAKLSVGSASEIIKMALLK